MKLQKILNTISALFLLTLSISYWMLTAEKLEGTFPHANGVITIKSARFFPFYPFDDKLLLIYNQNTAERVPKRLYSWSFCGQLSLPEPAYDNTNRIVSIRPSFSNCQCILPWEKGIDFYGAHLEFTNYSNGQITIEQIAGGTEY